MPIVTLSSDIGMQDYLVGAIKGQLLTAMPNATIVDISHYLSQSNFPEAAYICKNAFRHYPPKTVHVILLHVYENFKPHFLAVEYNKQLIICPDNGIITMLLDKKPKQVKAISLSGETNFLNITTKLAITIKEFEEGKELGETITDFVEKLPLQPVFEENAIRTHIIFIDNFENVVLNITQQQFESYAKGRKFKILFKRNETITQFSTHFFDVADGEKLAYFNASGYLELAINKGNMAGLFGLQGFNELVYKQGKSLQNKYFYDYVSIFFE